MAILGGKILCTLGGVTVVQYPDGRVEFTADAAIDGDGSPRCYNPISSLGLDDLANAGHDGNWWGIVTHNGRPSGDPVIQDANDPAPGFYVSSTAYEWAGVNHFTPAAYVDSETVPFIVIEGYIRRRAKGIVLGCRARVTNEKNGMEVAAVVADIGPLTAIGELSIACAKAIGVNPNPRNGGESEHVITYELFPGEAAKISGKVYDLIPA